MSATISRRIGYTLENRDRAERDRELAILYLRSRIAAWNASKWHDRVPSLVERRLTLTGSRAQRRTFSEESALDSRRLLVVLGGPGSGKTWLARRYARRSAESALLSLQNGADVADVEIPIYTTWDQWVRLADGQGNSVRASLISSSFDSDLPHGGGDSLTTVNSLKALLQNDATRILYVIDSLDEATGRDHTARFANLVGLASQQSRIVITSRAGAWDRIKFRLPQKDPSCMVVELEDLEYPADTEAFIRAWFQDEPSRARAVIDHLSSHPDVAAAAVVPLVLTFYCLIAGSSADDKALPTRRHSLYSRIVEDSLARANEAQGDDPEFRFQERLPHLKRWAWEAVGSANAPCGLGDWGESFTLSPVENSRDVVPLDSLVPRVGLIASRTTRKFQHRTILEHLVAEYVADLPSKEAANVLLPHLWFDTSWEVSAPAALAAHNRKRPGELLNELLAVIPRSKGAESPTEVVWRGFVRVVLRAAADSEPDEWLDEHCELILSARVDCLAWDPTIAVRVSHWPDRSNEVESAACKILDTSKSDTEAADLAEALAGMGLPADGRGRAFHVIRRRFESASDAAAAGKLAKALGGVAATDDDRHNALVAVLDRLEAADVDTVAVQIAESVPALTVGIPRSHTLRDRAIDLVMGQLSSTNVGDSAGAFCRVLSNMDLPTHLREEVVLGLRERFGEVRGGFTAVNMFDALLPLALDLPIESPSRRRLLTEMVNRIEQTDHGYLLARLASALPQLLIPEHDRARLRSVVVSRVLHSDNAELMSGMAEALLWLGVSDTERARVRKALISRIERSDDLYPVSELAGALPAFGPSEPEAADVLRLLVARALSQLGEWHVDRFVEQMPGLLAESTDGIARNRVLTCLQELLVACDPISDRYISSWIESFDSMGMLSLVPDVTLSRARDRFIRAISLVDDDFWAGRLAEILPLLGATVEDRIAAVDAILGRMETSDDSSDRKRLAGALPGVVSGGGAEVALMFKEHDQISGRPLSTVLVEPVRRVLNVWQWLEIASDRGDSGSKRLAQL
jgi:hypothetical protein